MPWFPKQGVVVPIDFSDNSIDAVRTALEFVEDRSAVHVIHVIVPLEAASPGVMWGAVDNESREKSVRHHFDEFIKEHGFDGVTAEVRLGHPGTEIADYASDVDAELVVIPSHGYHGVKRLLMGSVAEQVVRHVDCAVLVLRRSDAD